MVDLGVQKVADLVIETVNKMVLMMPEMVTKMEIGEVLVVEGDKAQEALRTLVIEMGGLGALVDVVGAGVGLVEVVTERTALENQAKIVKEALVVVLDVGGGEEAGVGLVEVLTGRVASENQVKMVKEALVVVLDVGGGEEAGVGLVEVMTGRMALEIQRKEVMAVLVVDLDVVVAEGAEVDLEEAGILKKEMAMVSIHTSHWLLMYTV